MIRDLKDQARTSLIHANRLWPDAISVELWPYALRHVNDCFNMTPFKTEKETPLEKFSRTKIRPAFRQIHPFGCPDYALDGRIQSGKEAKKWEVRARLAIYLGQSPQHARTVDLVLSLTTGLVSPQFHVKYDDTFLTLFNNSIPKSMWQYLAGFEPNKEPKKMIAERSEIPLGENNEIPSPSIHEDSKEIQVQDDRSIQSDPDDKFDEFQRNEQSGESDSDDSDGTSDVQQMESPSQHRA
jgi:hypothetical protein